MLTIFGLIHNAAPGGQTYLLTLAQIDTHLHQTDKLGKFHSINFIDKSLPLVHWKGEAERAFDPASPYHNSSLAQEYRAYVQSLSNEDMSCSKLVINTSFDPLGPAASDWIKGMRAILQQVRAATTHSGTIQSNSH